MSLNNLKKNLLYNIIKKTMDFSKMDRNEKIELCFERINDLELLDDKIETSASGVAQAKATLKQQMKRNKTALFNAMLDALALSIINRKENSKRTYKMKEEKNREISNLELRLSQLEETTRSLQKTVLAQNEEIEIMKVNLKID